MTLPPQNQATTSKEEKPPVIHEATTAETEDLHALSEELIKSLASDSNELNMKEVLQRIDDANKLLDIVEGQADDVLRRIDQMLAEDNKPS